MSLVQILRRDKTVFVHEFRTVDCLLRILLDDHAKSILEMDEYDPKMMS